MQRAGHLRLRLGHGDPGHRGGVLGLQSQHERRGEAKRLFMGIQLMNWVHFSKTSSICTFINGFPGPGLTYCCFFSGIPLRSHSGNSKIQSAKLGTTCLMASPGVKRSSGVKRAQGDVAGSFAPGSTPFVVLNITRRAKLK